MLKSFLSVFLKFPCPLCQRIADDTLCQYCQKKLLSYKLSNPKSMWKGNIPLFAWGKYDGELSRAIAEVKYNNRPELGILLGTWLGQTWLENCPLKSSSKVNIIPIPLSKKKQKIRGFNQAAEIAKGFCQVTKYPLVDNCLLRTKDTQAMFGLNPTQRQQTIKNAFQINPNWRKQAQPYPVLLLDDIYTRGTTIREAVKTLRKQNIEIAGAIALSKVTNLDLLNQKSMF